MEIKRLRKIFDVTKEPSRCYTNISPFCTTKLSYAHEPFLADSLDDLPLGEQRRFIQHGHFIWVDDDSLLNEQEVIANSAFRIERFTIPWYAKLSLATELYKDVYNGYAYQSDIAKIKRDIQNSVTINCNV